MAANFRKIAAYRDLVQAGDAHKVVARARRRRTSIAEYRPPPPTVSDDLTGPTGRRRALSRLQRR